MEKPTLSEMKHRYFILYKPYGMLSQFTTEYAGKKTLKDLDYPFPRDVYPVGRLDEDSEGLLLLTNNRMLNHRLLSPEFRHERTYWCQLEGTITPEAIQKLRKGVDITVEQKKYHTLPAHASLLDGAAIPDRIPPVRYRKKIPTSWVELTLIEGKNRQVRKMTAATGFPTLRLIRIGMEKISVSLLKPGEVSELDQETVMSKLNLVSL